MEPALLLTELKEVAIPGDIGPAPGLGIAFLGPAPSSSKSFLSSASLCSHFPRTEPTSILFRLLGTAWPGLDVACPPNSEARSPEPDRLINLAW